MLLKHPNHDVVVTLAQVRLQDFPKYVQSESVSVRKELILSLKKSFVYERKMSLERKKRKSCHLQSFKRNSEVSYELMESIATIRLEYAMIGVSV